MLDREADPHARGRATLQTVRRLAAIGPVVLAVDDLQWLDPVSGRILRYALRRLLDEDVRIVATWRVSGAPASSDGGWLDWELLQPGRLYTLTLGPMTINEIRKAVSVALAAVPRPMLERIHVLCQGNPLLAIRLARTVDRSGEPRVRSGMLPVPLKLGLATQEPRLVDLVRTAAALGPCAVAVLRAAHGLQDPDKLIQRAVHIGLLAISDDRIIRPASPLLSAAALADLDPLQRRDLHARLATVLDDPDEVARHLALSVDDPDEEIAALIAAAAERTGRHGSHSAAADLFRDSARLTPSHSLSRNARVLLGISHRAAAGDTAEALRLTDQLLKEMPPGRGRADALVQRVLLDLDAGAELLLGALADTADDSLSRGRILELLGWLLGTFRGELSKAAEYGRQALAIGRSTGDEELEMLSAATLSTMMMLAGRVEPELMQRAIALASAHDGPRLGRRPHIFQGRQCLWSGDLPRARQLFTAMRQSFDRAGIEFQRPYRLNDLTLTELCAGHLLAAQDLADEATQAAADAGNHQAVLWVSYADGLVAAHRGRWERAAVAVARLTEAGAALNQPPRTLMAQHIDGIVRLAAGDPVGALARLAAGVELADRLGIRCPGYLPLLPDAIEAAALAGDSAAARRFAGTLSEQDASLRQPWTRAAAIRGRGLARLTVAPLESAKLLETSAAAFAELGYRVDAARTLVLHGRALLRARHRRASAAVLGRAAAEFAAMDAGGWVAEVSRQLARASPGRAPGELTATERRIADDVLAGRRNRDIAAAQFISVATVEAHLTRIYRKLGIRSRTELVNYLHSQELIR